MKNKKLLIACMIPLLMGLFGCNDKPDEPEPIEEDDFVVPSETPTPSGKTYDFYFDDEEAQEPEDKISISSKEDLLNFAQKVNEKNTEYVNAYVELTTDIVLEDKWTPIEGFKGQLNGKGHTISGLKIETKQIRQGLFSYVDGARIGCLTIAGDITAGDNSALLSGYPGSGTGCKHAPGF